MLDVEDDDVIDYINNQEQANLKRVIWSEMNKDYLQSQAAKEANKDAPRDPNLPPKKKIQHEKRKKRSINERKTPPWLRKRSSSRNGCFIKNQLRSFAKFVQRKGRQEEEEEIVGYGGKSRKISTKGGEADADDESRCTIGEESECWWYHGETKARKEDLPAPAAAPAKKTATKPVAKAAAAVAEKDEREEESTATA